MIERIISKSARIGSLLVLSIASALWASPQAAEMEKSGTFQDCCAVLQQERLTIENSRVKRVYRWNGGNLISERIENKITGRGWDLKAGHPDCTFPGEPVEAADGTIQIQQQQATSIRPAYLSVEVLVRLGDLKVKRVFRIFPNCPAIACDFYISGKPGEQWAKIRTKADRYFEILASKERIVTTVMESLRLSGSHWRYKAVNFYDVTDRYNTLVEETYRLGYPRESYMAGNLLFIDSTLEDAGLFVLKEAPPGYVQPDYAGMDFSMGAGDVQVLGIGLTPEEVQPDQWVRGYGVVTGVTGGGQFGRLKALREYQNCLRIRIPKRDEMVMMNTWGDRGGGKNISEAFILAELEAAAKLGISHYQIDAGWGPTLEPTRTDLLKIEPNKFPKGFGPVVKKASDLGIELCLWTAPGMDTSYADWQTFSDTLIGFYKEYGIRTFKFDGAFMQNKQAETRLREMLDRVMAATGDQAVFNLDITAYKRFGYHYFNEYGNYFVENRYTDWGNYYPHYTLRNLWMLSRYVPPQCMQFEFLNTWRQTEKYSPDDPLAPAKVPFEYAFAVTMMSQPLAWFEATGLPEEGFAIGPVIKTYRQHQRAIHEGIILPIGEEPSGTGWTGFQSIQENKGYFLVFRERNEQDSAKLKVWDLADRTVECRAILGQGTDFTATPDAEGAFGFDLPAMFSYALFEYMVK